MKIRACSPLGLGARRFNTTWFEHRFSPRVFRCYVRNRQWRRFLVIRNDLWVLCVYRSQMFGQVRQDEV